MRHIVKSFTALEGKAKYIWFINPSELFLFLLLFITLSVSVYVGMKNLPMTVYLKKNKGKKL